MKSRRRKSSPSWGRKRNRCGRYKFIQGALLIVWPAVLLLALLTFPRHRSGNNPAPIHHDVSIESTLKASPSDIPTPTTQKDHIPALKISSEGLNDWLTGAVHSPGALRPKDPAQIKFAEDGDNLVTSTVIVHASTSGTGLVNKFYYRFKNVQLTKNKLTVFYNPATQAPPNETLWIDMVSGNATSPALPTMFAIKGDSNDVKWYYLPIEYLPMTKHQPKCTSWVEPFTFLLQARYSYNIWHTWNEGLMGIFQTLRELAELPLASVGDNGRLTEITDGMGGEGCPWYYDASQIKVVQLPKCPPRDGLLESDTCDPSTQSWCRKGAVVSMRRSSAGGPVILPYSASSLMNVWSHLYSALSENVRDFEDLQGACFRDIVMGKSSTLNFYQAINSTEPDPQSLKHFPRVDAVEERVEAMAVFKAFVTSAQREWVAAEINRTGEQWGGYSNPLMEKLRQGVGPENLDFGVLDGMSVSAVPGMLREELTELKKLHARRSKSAAKSRQEFIKVYGTAADWKAKAERQGTLDSVQAWDYYNEDDEAVAARELIKRKGGGTGVGVGEVTTATSKKASSGHRRRLLSISSSFSSNSSVNVSTASSAPSVLHRSLLALHLSSSGPRWFDKGAVFHHETPRPVVTYTSRNFFSRGVLNERDILEYVLQRYNVTLRVTTFEEPLLEVMETLGSTDVMFGMHGAGWTNALFVKRGATTLQMFPYGWRIPDGSTVRGYNYREIVLASECGYREWVNPTRELAFFRRVDYTKKWNMTYSLHPNPEWPLPSNSWPGNPWIYQNTYVDMDLFGPQIDELMDAAGIPPMAGLTRNKQEE